MDYQGVIDLVVEVVKHALPIRSYIFNSGKGSKYVLSYGFPESI